MARETREPTRQSTSASPRSERDKAAGSVQQSERERSIQTGRDTSGEGRESGLARRDESSLVRGPSSPYSLMRRMAEDMDQLFENFGLGRGLGLTSRFPTMLGGGLWDDLGSMSQSSWTPQIETFRRGNNIVVRADIPGVKKEDVRVEIENDTLTISGERREEHEEDREGYYRSERSYGQFYRAIPLPEGVNGDQCDASFRDGVLEITLPAPKQEERKAKKIHVR